MNDEKIPEAQPVLEQPPQPPEVSLPPQTPTATPTPSSSTEGVWVPKTEYDSLKVAEETKRIAEFSDAKKAQVFQTLLAISGLMLGILYIGMLLGPAVSTGRGCSSQGFMSIAFWLNPLAYSLLLVTGIIGVTSKQAKPKSLGVLFIIGSPIAWFFTGLAILGSVLCGV